MPRPARKPRQAAPDRSESTEDHLERIQELVEQKGYARVADLALSLRLSRSAVSNIVRRQTLTEMLDLLGLSPDTVKQEVEAIEHHLKPETLQIFSKLVRFWRAHPGQLQLFLKY